MNKIDTKIKCFHCGLDCDDNSIFLEEKYFCCNGCKSVYQLLNSSDLYDYYDISTNPGIKPQITHSEKFNFLDDKKFIDKILEFKDDKYSIVNFYIPSIHCSSCIWLLENLNKLDSSIVQSTVNFLKKELKIRFITQDISLKEISFLLTSIGYEPSLNIENKNTTVKTSSYKNILLKIGIAGFCFGNIMLFSFPGYLGIDASNKYYITLFNYLNLFLSLPVFFYAASDYLISAYKAISNKFINIDIPLALGITVLFIRSIIDVTVFSTHGYFDSLSGLVFFLLIGKYIQQKTYDSINFERNYKSFFPISSTVLINGEKRYIPIEELKVGNRILVRNGELIPADSILFNGTGYIDYSFVTGESRVVPKVSGELVYAGGKQKGNTIELEIIKEVSQSYLTQLWNDEIFNKKDKNSFNTLTNIISKYFIISIILIALASTTIWFFIDSSIALKVFTSVLIVACPCALALSAPFTLGNTQRIFGHNRFYLKDTSTIEKLNRIDLIVFDKTGTLTIPEKNTVQFVGKQLNPFYLEMVKSLVVHSTHPLSQIIYQNINTNDKLEVKNYDEQVGLGISGEILGNKIKIGSEKFIIKKNKKSSFGKTDNIDSETRVFIQINEKVSGYFKIQNVYREGLNELAQSLGKNYESIILSGDNNSEENKLKKIFGNKTELYFNQSPKEKLNFIKSMQQMGEKVLMIGDGLNDSGALKQSDVGISVTEKVTNFFPACDALLDSNVLAELSKFIKFSKTSYKIIIISFVISFLYNIIGLSFAVQGLLSPIVAAILMSVSSISVVLFATISTNLLAKKRGLKFLS